MPVGGRRYLVCWECGDLYAEPRGGGFNALLRA